VSTESERWFDEYLDANGYTYWPEPDLGVPTRPDRLIERVGEEAICEVKEFTTDAMQRRWPEGGSQISSAQTALRRPVRLIPVAELERWLEANATRVLD
jgi:hypothetical protein